MRFGFNAERMQLYTIKSWGLTGYKDVLCVRKIYIHTIVSDDLELKLIELEQQFTFIK